MSDKCWREEGRVFRCGQEDLVGILHRPHGDVRPRVGVVIVVGGPQYRVGSHRQFVSLARTVASHGFPVLRFDYRGMGDASGSENGFENIDEDIAAAVHELRASRTESLGIVLIGLCDGASASLMHTSRADVAGLVLVNPWVRTQASEATAYVRHYYLRRVLQADFWIKLVGGGISIRASTTDFLLKLATSLSGAAKAAPAEAVDFISRMERALASYRGRSLVVLSGQDLTAREFEALTGKGAPWNRLRGTATGPVRRVTIATADHTFSSAADLERSSEIIVDWLKQEFPPLA
jgi:uncharacterized protein